MRILKRIATPSLIVMALLGAAPTVWGQGATSPPAQNLSVEPREFLRLAHSSATLQSQAAKLAASRDTRPEVKSFATAASEFRTGLLQRIETFAKEKSLPLPSTKEFEHQVIIENLEPLDYLALSRRYAEIQLQALEQEIGIYRTAAQAGNQDIKAFASQILPELERQQEEARRVREAVGP